MNEPGPSRLIVEVTPADALIDVPRRVVVSGAAAGATITISAKTNRAGRDWTSHASFIADASGIVDLTRDAPVSGSYAGVSPMGLIWSQLSPDGNVARELFHGDVRQPLVTLIQAQDEDGRAAQAALTQHLMAPGVTRHDVRDHGLVGTLFLPSGPGPHPALLILNGSGGGINEPRAALYASHGYAAFALAYFKAPGLPNYISNTPLEYFASGLDWLRQRVQPAHDFVAVSGQSRGGELALLLGATFPDKVSAVIGYVPGAVVHPGQNAADPAVGREGPAWLLGGMPLVDVWQGNRTASWTPFDEGPEPHRHEWAILTALQDADAVERARIQVEKIRGPVLLLSGSDDGAWPSARYCQMARDKLVAVQHPHDVRWLDVPRAGHSILFPYVPTTPIVHRHPVSGRVTTMGGAPPDNADANEQSWREVLDFLRSATADAASDNRGR